MRIASIWAQDRNGVLGTGTGMCWRVPADFRHFKESTMGAPIIMGRSSWEALGGALPGRLNIVMTRSREYTAENGVVVHSLAEALEVATQQAAHDGVDVVWIVGGGAVYTEAMEIVDELVISHLDLDVSQCSEDDAGHPVTKLVYAPAIDPAIWRVDEERSDAQWRPVSGDARWKVVTYIR